MMQREPQHAVQPDRKVKTAADRYIVTSIYPYPEPISRASVVARARPASPRIWDALLRAAGDVPGTPLSGSYSLLPIREWRVAVTPRAEEPGSKASELDAANPLKVDWSFEAMNLLTGEKLAVTDTDPPALRGTPGVRVVMSPLEGIADREAAITFPASLDGALYQVDVHISVKNADGRATPPVHRRIWSHVVPVDTALTLVKDRVGTVGYEGILSALSNATRGGLTQEYQRDGLFKTEWLLASLMEQASAQPFVTVNDLGRFVRLVNLLRSRKERKE
jgi:hypothetical protein